MKLGVAPGLSVLILAAGFSTRLGYPKALARIRGLSLLRRTAGVLAPLSSRPLIVVTPPRCPRYRQELRGVPACLIANAGRASGLAGSLRLGLRAARWSAAVLIAPVDLAAIDRVEVIGLVRRWQATRRRVVARRIGARAGTPLILPKRFFHLAQSISGDTGLRDLLADMAMDERVLIDMPSAVRDIDTPIDLELARRAQTLR